MRRVEVIPKIWVEWLQPTQPATKQTVRVRRTPKEEIRWCPLNYYGSSSLPPQLQNQVWTVFELLKPGM